MKDKKLKIELTFLLVISLIVFIVAAKFDILEQLVELSRKHESWELDEFITLLFFSSFVLTAILLRRWLEIKRTNKKLIYSHSL